MAGTSDKARFYLEQTVPELREYERKKLFSKEEIQTLTSRRSDFEHLLNSRACRPADIARYVAYETNLSLLASKRRKRLGVKNNERHRSATDKSAAARRITAILERGLKRFPGDLGLWMQRVRHARTSGEGGEKAVLKVLTRLVRLHPTRADVWCLAAGYVGRELGDVSGARDWVMRGLRFCGGEERLWMEWGRVEMSWLGKIEGRRRVLGIAEKEAEVDVEETEGAGEGEEERERMEELIGETGRDLTTKKTSNDVLGGALIRAVFDAAVEKLGPDSDFASSFFDMILEYDVPARLDMLGYILNHSGPNTPKDPTTLINFVSAPLLDAKTTSTMFPDLLDTALDRLDWAMQHLKSQESQVRVSQAVRDSLSPHLEAEGVDEDIRRVMLAVTERI